MLIKEITTASTRRDYYNAKIEKTKAKYMKERSTINNEMKRGYASLNEWFDDISTTHTLVCGTKVREVI